MRLSHKQYHGLYLALHTVTFLSLSQLTRKEMSVFLYSTNQGKINGAMRKQRRDGYQYTR